MVHYQATPIHHVQIMCYRIAFPSLLAPSQPVGAEVVFGLKSHPVDTFQLHKPVLGVLLLGGVLICTHSSCVSRQGRKLLVRICLVFLMLHDKH